MTARIVSFCLLLTVWLCFPAIAKAQEESKSSDPSAPADEDPVTQGELDEALAKLEKRLTTRIEALTKSLNAVQQPKVVASVPSGRTGKVTRPEVNKLWDLVTDQDRAIKQIAKRASGQDGQEMYALNISGQMRTNPTFRKEFAEAVRDSIPRYGKLRVQNRMATEQYLLVNRRRYRIPAFSSVEIEVRVGTVTTELEGWEHAKNWTVGPPNYLQEILIAARPTPPVLVSPPVVVDPITWVWW